MTTPSPVAADKLVGMFGALKDHEQEITLRQLGTIGVLLTTPGCSVREIAGKLDISKPAVTRALQALGELGYVEKQPGEADRRLVRASVTSKGKAFAERFVKAGTA